MAGRVGSLYLVGTPIGNLGDLSERARQTLASVDVVACEDTRRTGRLLASFGVKARKLVSFFEGNERERVPELIRALREGSDVAVVSDAGMPGLSDPGYRLVAACVEEGIPVDVVPGPSAAIAALVVSGLPTDRFVFEGFLPRSGRARRARLGELKDEARTMVLFESPRRLTGTLMDLAEAVGDRRVAVAREMTKLHQEILRGTLRSVADQMSRRDIRGEIVVVVEGTGQRGRPEDAEQAVRLATSYVQQGERKRTAARRASAETGVPAARIYQALVGGDRPLGDG